MVAFVDQGAVTQTAITIDSFGYTSGNALVCGDRTFSISPTTYTCLTLASDVLTLQSTNPAEVISPTTITITAELTNYQTVKATQIFTIEIICKVTALSWSPALLTTHSHILKIDAAALIPFAVT